MVLSPSNPLMSVERIRTASVLAPLLVLNLISASVALIATPMIGTGSNWLWIAFLLCFLCTLGAYCYWSIKAPIRGVCGSFRKLPICPDGAN